MRKVYSGLVEAAAENYLIEMFEGGRVVSDDEYQVTLISSAMHILSNCPWSTPIDKMGEEKKTWGGSDNPPEDGDEREEGI